MAKPKHRGPLHRQAHTALSRRTATATGTSPVNAEAGGVRPLGPPSAGSPSAPVTAPSGQRPTGTVVDNQPDGVAVAARPSWLRRNRWWLIALGALIVSHTISALVGVVGAHHISYPVWSQPHYNQNAGGLTQGAGGFLTAWDSYWYLNAAQHGWPHVLIASNYNTTGFFPALPLALRAVHAISGFNWTVTGFVVEAVIEVAAVLVISILARRVLGERVGNDAVILFCLFPGAFILSQVYSEPLFILFVATCLYGLHRRWWWLAGLAAALAGATRPTGLVLMSCCAWVALREIWLRRDWSSLIAPALSPIGMLAFLVFLRARTGTSEAYLLTQQHAWGQTFTIHAIPNELRNHFILHQPYAWVLLVFLLWGVAGLGLLAVHVHRRQLPSEWFLYCLGGIFLTLTSNFVGFKPRSAWVAFPLIFACAGFLRRWWAMVPAVGVCVAGLALFSYGVPSLVP